MRLGLQVPNFTWPNGQSQLGKTFGEIAERADKAGLYSMWVMDHFFQIGLSARQKTRCLKRGVRWLSPPVKRAVSSSARW